jgi:hypothetical protein
MLSAVIENSTGAVSGASSAGTRPVDPPGPRWGDSPIWMMQSQRGAMSQKVTLLSLFFRDDDRTERTPSQAASSRVANLRAIPTTEPGLSLRPHAIGVHQCTDARKMRQIAPLLATFGAARRGLQATNLVSHGIAESIDRAGSADQRTSPEPRGIGSPKSATSRTADCSLSQRVMRPDRKAS